MAVDLGADPPRKRINPGGPADPAGDLALTTNTPGARGGLSPPCRHSPICGAVATKPHKTPQNHQTSYRLRKPPTSCRLSRPVRRQPPFLDQDPDLHRRDLAHGGYVRRQDLVAQCRVMRGEVQRHELDTDRALQLGPEPGHHLFHLSAD